MTKPLRAIICGCLAAVLLLSACDSFVFKKEEEPPDVEAEVLEIVGRFRQEAQAAGRGEVLPLLDSLKVTIKGEVIFDRERLCGVSLSYWENQLPRPQPVAPSIEIANNETCWTGRTKWDHEILVFHELGHAILNRGHLENSIMATDWSGLYDGDENPSLRSSYIKELFAK